MKKKRPRSGRHDDPVQPPLCRIATVLLLALLICTPVMHVALPPEASPAPDLTEPQYYLRAPI